jgi:hypothetical protein
MNKYTYLIIGIIVLGVVVVSINKMSTNSIQKNTTQQIKTVSVKNTSQDPQDIVPGLYTNTIKNNSTISGLTIVSGLVENNLDQNGKPTDDHLELVIKNSSSKDASNFEAYYTITDTVTNKQEGYYKKLTGLTLKSGESKTIHFDTKVSENHFGLNTNGMYFTGKNKMIFDVQISSPEFKVATLKINKDAGGAEVKD